MNKYVGSAVGGAVLGTLVALIVNRKHKGKKQVLAHALTGAGVAFGLQVATNVAPDPLKKPLLIAQGKGPMFAAGFEPRFEREHEHHHPHDMFPFQHPHPHGW